MSLFANIQKGIYYFNAWTITESYQMTYYLGAIIFFIVSYTSQLIIDKPCYGIIPTITRMLHHMLIYFIYFSFLAPSNILSISFIISFLATISWVIFKNKCIITLIENWLCGHTYNRTFHDLTFYLSRKFDRFLSKIRISLVGVMTIWIILRIYVYYRTNRIEVQGHRGARGNRPENTMAAFEFALDNGIMSLELDLHMTSDGVLVIYHNESINQTICKSKERGVGSGTSLSISKMTLNELKQYDCGSLKNDDFPQQELSKQSIPTFLELIAVIKKKYPLLSVKMNIEIKTRKGRESEDYVKMFTKKVVDILEEHRLTNSCIVQSFDIRVLKYAKELNPKIVASFLLENYTESNVEPFVELCVTNKVDIFSPDSNQLNKDIVDKFHKKHIKVLPWTVNSVEELKRMLDYKVDGIISDYPVVMKEYLAVS